ncbi:monovalent cation/H+ antiporter complex subunit F [Parvibaculum sp.]|jgi:multicomponent Na+:H+ antiporter subunit F|uniref:monovalent cation/H+ antiporter complex subunit F n=1 Tax=Parvibaculum sp. TaxID=2024848 RepID=UPI001B13304F|nr:monovalent cation/H+ antiporter complex subunit F [Parvibaculum sp.]MBO6636287.1 pH regulation protein F [Parvibaculum sp.]MBO6680293.1 pH regulation protein F [Parvibaculum sp.]MBO6686354.1 pH regulation protein F [Parvibaculum sp.]MBO6904696.1 pH regulation protein F [Parvibaculum sp.]
MAMLLAITAALFVAVLLVLIRLFAGPTLYDRVLAVNTFGTLTVLLLSALGFVTERPDFLDIAMLYALINFVSTIAILKFFRYRALGRATASGEDV